MYFSCLFPARDQVPAHFATDMPASFQDLNLDQIVEAATADYSAFDIRKHYYTLLTDLSVIRYRQSAAEELRRPEVYACVHRLCEIVVAVSRLLPKLRTSLIGQGPMENNAMTKGAFLNAAVKYAQALQVFADSAETLSLRSGPLQGFADYLQSLFATEAWQGFSAHTTRVRKAFDAAQYTILIKNSGMKVRKYEDQEDEGAYVARLFDRFSQGEGQTYTHAVNENAIAYHVESALLEILVKLYPDEFADLSALCETYPSFLDGVVERFALEMQFYFSYLSFIEPISRRGMAFCCPQFTQGDQCMHAEALFDLALAHNRLREESMPVANDLSLEPHERVIVVSGPNQGGKTTFARSLGQCIHIARIGLPVACQSACLRPFTRLFTHFEKEENVENGAGKLMDDLQRLKPMLSDADADTFFVINEIFASTTLTDATAISRKVMEQILSLRCTGVWVTFIDEMAAYGPSVVSMMSMVEEGDSDKRTFRIQRKAADGLAHAMTIARKHALTYEQLKRRLMA